MVVVEGSVYRPLDFPSPRYSVSVASFLEHVKLPGHQSFWLLRNPDLDCTAWALECEGSGV